MKNNVGTADMVMYVMVGVLILLAVMVVVSKRNKKNYNVMELVFSGGVLLCTIIIMVSTVISLNQMEDDKKEIKQEENKFLDLSELQEAGYDVYVNGKKRSGEIRLEVWEFKCEVQIDDENKQIWVRVKEK